ncbi:MAG: Xaa-Pro peptidase family protein [Rubrivivax sp.]
MPPDAAPAATRAGAFTADEYAARLQRLRQRLAAARVDVALFDEIEAMTWLSGYGNSENRWRCVGVPLGTEPFFVIRALDATPCRQRTWITEVNAYADWDDPFPVLAGALARRGLAGARIGLDFMSYGMPLARFESLKRALPQCSFVDLGPLVWELRLHKSPAEVDLLTRAAAIADEAMTRAAGACSPGASQRDAARIAAATFIARGADPGPPGPISAGRGWDFLHGHLEDGPLRAGDVVHLELTPRVAGYSARLMRCVAVGSAASATVDAMRRLVECQDRQIAAMRPGADAAEVDAILRHALLASGLRTSFDNISGYTLGLYAAAGPRTSDFTRIFHPKARWTVESGMVFHMYASAAGVSVSETVHVRADGPHCLSRLPRELFVRP